MFFMQLEWIKIFYKNIFQKLGFLKISIFLMKKLIIINKSLFSPSFLHQIP